jgi:hypothetical protein
VLTGRGLCDELRSRPEEYYRLCCVVVCDLETSRIDVPYIYDISNLRVNDSVPPFPLSFSVLPIAGLHRKVIPAVGERLL